MAYVSEQMRAAREGLQRNFTQDVARMGLDAALQRYQGDPNWTPQMDNLATLFRQAQANTNSGNNVAYGDYAGLARQLQSQGSYFQGSPRSGISPEQELQTALGAYGSASPRDKELMYLQLRDLTRRGSTWFNEMTRDPATYMGGDAARNQAVGADNALIKEMEAQGFSRQGPSPYSGDTQLDYYRNGPTSSWQRGSPAFTGQANPYPGRVSEDKPNWTPDWLGATGPVTDPNSAAAKKWLAAHPDDPSAGGLTRLNPNLPVAPPFYGPGGTGSPIGGGAGTSPTGPGLVYATGPDGKAIGAPLSGGAPQSYGAPSQAPPPPPPPVIPPPPVSGPTQPQQPAPPAPQPK